MRQATLGVIGCGVIGPHHIQSAAELPVAHVAAVADLSEERARAVAEQYGIAAYHTDPIALLNDPAIEGVILALPAGFRAGLAVEALKRGKHVMLEKPAARSANELLEIANAAGDRQVACASARYCLMPHAKPLADFIATGALGDLRSIHFRNLAPPGPEPTSPPPAWRVSKEQNGGGILVNWGIYELDYIFGITGWKLAPHHVLASWWPISPQFGNYVSPNSDADEHFSAFIACDGGTVISLERGERVPTVPQSALSIIGTKGSLSLAMLPDTGKKIVFHNSAQGRGVWDEVVWQGDETWDDARIGIVRDFAEAIVGNRPPQTDLKRGMILQKITDAIYESKELARPIEIR